VIIGTGIDIVDITRIEKLLAQQGKRFIARTFTPKEQRTCEARAERASAYAKRFAAKEACAKALGCGIGKDALFTEIEVNNDKRGAPSLTLRGAALSRLKAITPKGKKAVIFLALTDEYPYANAQVIIEAQS
jgi:holo-[acyl-carrier protein] synthase